MYAPAYMSLGWTYWLEWTWQWSRDPQTLERAFALAQKAKALDGSLASIRILLGWIYPRQKQHKQAIAEGKCAIALDPKGAYAYTGLGSILNSARRPEEAVGLAEHALRLEPEAAAFSSLQLGLSYYLMRRHEEAITDAQRALVRFPQIPGVHTLLAASMARQVKQRRLGLKRTLSGRLARVSRLRFGARPVHTKIQL